MDRIRNFFSSGQDDERQNQDRAVARFGTLSRPVRGYNPLPSKFRYPASLQRSRQAAPPAERYGGYGDYSSNPYALYGGAGRKGRSGRKKSRKSAKKTRKSKRRSRKSSRK
jgi:hypothetical protein